MIQTNINKVSLYIIIVQVIFYPGYFENRIVRKPALGGVCSLTNYGVTYENTKSSRASDYRDFVCSLFPKAVLFDFYFKNLLSQGTSFPTKRRLRPACASAQSSQSLCMTVCLVTMDTKHFQVDSEVSWGASRNHAYIILTP